MYHSNIIVEGYICCKNFNGEGKVVKSQASEFIEVKKSCDFPLGFLLIWRLTEENCFLGE